jgi:hypothetical protein
VEGEAEADVHLRARGGLAGRAQVGEARRLASLVPWISPEATTWFYIYSRRPDTAKHNAVEVEL